MIYFRFLNLFLAYPPPILDSTEEGVMRRMSKNEATCEMYLRSAAFVRVTNFKFIRTQDSLTNKQPLVCQLTNLKGN